MDDQLTHAELEQALIRLRVGVRASDLQGSLSGYLCTGGRAGADDWPDALQLDIEGATLTRDPVLQRLYRDCLEQFQGPCADVVPLLPSDGLPLSQRVDALAQWCQGFLGGCGLTGALSRDRLSSDVAEILADFHGIATGQFGTDDSPEDEQAFSDVLDFVRTAAAWLHREVRTDGRPTHSVH